MGWFLHWRFYDLRNLGLIEWSPFLLLMVLVMVTVMELVIRRCGESLLF